MNTEIANTYAITPAMISILCLYYIWSIPNGLHARYDRESIHLFACNCNQPKG